ncbi:fatty acid synthase alpha subunit Lsd1 [Paramarasmius palmivorus]|uniref:Fatty acid synthase alpha subunit Lsd1 n=1 Tax=Paramarasmius palmivorus TaxID=297713 RepID=A0AAW0BIH7_9AGAR
MQKALRSSTESRPNERFQIQDDTRKIPWHMPMFVYLSLNSSEKKKVFYQEFELIHDLEPIEVDESEAQKFELQHGDNRHRSRRLHLRICVLEDLFRRTVPSPDTLWENTPFSPISALVDVVFYRGITMQRAVERDSKNRSNYAMCAVNPSRISKTFSDAALREVVDTIATITDSLLEIVNYNVESQQYVCAGELVALQTMANVLNKVNIAKQLTETFSVEKVKEMLGDIVKECHARALEQQQTEGSYIKLDRGFASIPLPGISTRDTCGLVSCLSEHKINPAHLNPDVLVGNYIPNLIAKPFKVTREYVQIIYGQTSSPRLDKVLKKWDQDQWGAEEQRQRLAYIILVEVLAYQFASPVRWIETQDLFSSCTKNHFTFQAYRFSSFDVEQALASENQFRMTCEAEGDFLDEPVDVDYNYHEVTDVDELEKIGAEYFKAVGTQGSSTVETVNDGPPALPKTRTLASKKIPAVHSKKKQAFTSSKQSSSSKRVSPSSARAQYKPAPLSTKTMLGSTRKQRATWNRTSKGRERRALAAQERDERGDITSDSLGKALKANHLAIDFDAATLPISGPAWIGLREIPSEKLPPISTLKEFKWDGKTTVLFVDKHNRIWAVLGAGINDKTWEATITGATSAIETFHDTAGLTAADYDNRRSKQQYAATPHGVSNGGGQKRPANIAVRRLKTRRALQAFQENACITRLVGHTGAFSSKHTPYWAAFTINSSTKGSQNQVATHAHTDYGNYARSWCAVTALGNFNPDHGGQLIMWNVGIIIRFPPGTTILFPSALVTHSNLPVRPGDTRYSLVQYSAGGLFRWVGNGGMSDKTFLSTASEEQLEQWTKRRLARAKEGLRQYTKLDELRHGDYKGEELGDLSDLTDMSESEDSRVAEPTFSRPKFKQKVVLDSMRNRPFFLPRMADLLGQKLSTFGVKITNFSSAQKN